MRLLVADRRLECYRLGMPDEEANANDDVGELDSLRMRHIVVIRRAAMRSRTYCIVGAGGCLIGAIKLILMTVAEVRRFGWHLRQISFVLFAVAAFFGVSYFLGRAAHWNRESRRSAADTSDDLPPPDFSTLSDGSQHARNLEDIR